MYPFLYPPPKIRGHKVKTRRVQEWYKNEKLTL